METKSLLIGIISFIAGALLVSIAATTFEKEPEPASNSASLTHADNTLADKTGDEFDKAFLVEMIKHHEGALDMAKLSETQAKHSEIKQLSKDIIVAQEKEINQMEQWQSNWGYKSSDATQGSTSPTAH